jgi:Tol biopolymer transport system component
MTTNIGAHAGIGVRQTSKEQAKSSLNFDRTYSLATVFFVLGLFIDGWAHNHGRVDESFFTPWHAIFYSGYMLLGAILLLKITRNQRQGFRGLKAIPSGYNPAMAGLLVFGFGGVGDLIWHTLFGIEENTEALLSPTHMLLGIGIILMASGPFLSARDRQDGGWRRLMPAIVAVLAMWSVLSFLTQFAHPLVGPWSVSNVATEEISGELFVMAADGTAQTRLTQTMNAFDTHPALSPDGRTIVYASEIGEGYELFLAAVDGSGHRQLTDNGQTNWTPDWSPDGQQIVFASDASGQTDIMVINIDGSGQRTLISDPGEDWDPAWSRDGANIAYVAGMGEAAQINVVDLEGNLISQLDRPGAPVFHPAWGADGDSLIFASTHDDFEQLFLADLPSGELTLLTETGSHYWSPAISPDGTKIAFTADHDSDDEIYVMNLDGSGLTNISQNPAFHDGFANWSADGETLIYRARGTSSGDGFAEAAIMLGIATIILQTALMTGAIMLLARRWKLPFGTFTALLAVNALAMVFMDDEFRLVPAALLAGLAADGLYAWLKIGPSDTTHLRKFGFLVALLFYALYMTTLFITDTIHWSIHVWTGAIVIAGLVGWLVAYLAVNDRPTSLNNTRG